MDAQLVIALLNPALGTLLAVTFLLLWMKQREQAYLLVAAAAFGGMGLGSLFLDVFPPLPLGGERFVANLLFLTSATLVAAAILMRRNLAVPVNVYAALVAVPMAGVIWFLLIAPDVGVRIGIVNAALGAISLLLAVQLIEVRGKQLIDWLILSVAVLTAINYFGRPIAIVHFMGGFGGYSAGTLSFYGATVIFSQAMLSVMFALNLIVANAVDLHAELRREANLDRLSGLRNRRGFEEAANRELDRCAADRRPVCLLVADLDHFKAINDTWGHGVGDRVIALFGKRLLELTEEGAVAGRVGGEEFAVLLPETDLASARLFAHKLRTCFGMLEGAGLPSGLTATVSIGISRSPDGNADLYELLSEADKALYSAKRAGRDQMQVFVPALNGDAESGRDLLTA
ncbi:GGDEF domain-containing protein [Hyphomonas sp.]|uniref:GGDEF domain-containing protein n=1 Tax=Hyphomonas sp. TaxID=87 RepID=UPI00391BD357